MSTSTDLNKIEDKRKEKLSVNTKGESQPRNGTSWMYQVLNLFSFWEFMFQPNQNNRQRQQNYQQDFTKDVQPSGWYYSGKQIQSNQVGRPMNSYGKPKQYGRGQKKKSFVLPRVNSNILSGKIGFRLKRLRLTWRLWTWPLVQTISTVSEASSIRSPICSR